MSDDMVKRNKLLLRKHLSMSTYAKVRIENGLTPYEQLDGVSILHEDYVWLVDRIEELEANLAKAVEALVRISDMPSEMTWGVDSEVREAMNGMEIIAETTLAELTGESHE